MKMSGNKELPIRPALAGRTEPRSLEMKDPPRVPASWGAGWVLEQEWHGANSQGGTVGELPGHLHGCLEANSTDQDVIHILALAQIEWENSEEQRLSVQELAGAGGGGDEEACDGVLEPNLRLSFSYRWTEGRKVADRSESLRSGPSDASAPLRDPA